jgi:glucose-1-phosphate adenylyltransferase
LANSLDDILAVILGGGRGARLYPLTQQRSKPAVPIAGKYRLIDIPISNCINSEIFRVAVLTQFNSVSLHRHISRTYQFDVFHTGWVQIWAAEQTMETTDWYQGTADAVRKQLFEIRSTRAKHVLILAGDHLYRMDYAAMAEFHFQKQADITVAVQPVKKEDAPRYGILKRDPSMQISDFAEKPTDPDQQSKLVSRANPDSPFLGSMGIYLFNIDVLEELLHNTTYDDFGGNVIPSAIHSHKVFGYDFDDYWEDIGTIRSFYNTNLELTQPNPPFNLYDPSKPIYTHPRYLPGSSIDDSHLENVLLAEGCTIRKADIRHSVVGLRSQVGVGAKIIDSILMGSDYYESQRSNTIAMGIGSGSHIEGAIIDKNARIGQNVTILPFPPGTDMDGDACFVRDGIVVIPKNGIVPDGTYIGPGEKKTSR